ncbi:MAG: hypothetical protein ACYCP0_03345 [Acidiferrobacteraceae bacterium]
MSESEPHSSEEAREQAELHRRELSDTLDAIGDRLQRTLDGAEQQISRPLAWVRRNPWVAVGISAAAGILLAGRRRPPRSTRHSVLTRELETAYLDGRQDEQRGAPVRGVSYWRNRKLDAQEALAPPAPGGNLLIQLAEPVIKAAIAAVTQAISNR